MFSLVWEENQGSDVDINSQPHEHHTLSLSPDALKAPYFSPPLSLNSSCSLQKHQAYERCSMKNTNEFVTPTACNYLVTFSSTSHG